MMHPAIQQAMALEHLAELRRDAQRRPYVEPAVRMDESLIELRLCRVGDDAALEDLATLNERPLPAGSFVVAVVNGRLVAALPIDGGPLLADPFVRTAHLHRLLELRVAQIQPPTRRGFHLPGLARRAAA